jgi:hypothetical protein
MAKGKKSKGDNQKPIEEMNTAEMLVRAMNVFSDRNISVGRRRKMIQAIESILAEPEESQPDEPDVE